MGFDSVIGNGSICYHLVQKYPIDQIHFAEVFVCECASKALSEKVTNISICDIYESAGASTNTSQQLLLTL